MIAEERLSQGGETLLVRIPMRFEPRGGRKRIIAPDGKLVVPDMPQPPRVDDVLVRALGKAWRWKRMLDGGAYATIGELAAAEKVNFSYLCRVLRLALLPPQMVEAILEGKQEEGATLEALLNKFG